MKARRMVSDRTRVRYLVGAAVLATAALLPPDTKAGPSSTKIVYRLKQGWNLSNFPFVDPHIPLNALEAHGLSAWPSATQPDGHLRSPPETGEGTREALDPYAGTWVWSHRDIELSIEGQLVTDTGPRSPSSTPWIHVSPQKRRPYEDSDASRLLAWDTEANHYVRMKPGDLLEPGVAYWAEAQPHHAAQNPRDAHAPALFVFSPSAKNVRTDQRWLRLEGTVEDPNLLGLYINRVRVHEASSSFIQMVRLEPGPNHIVLEAVDHAQNRRILEKHVFYEPPPKKVSGGPTPDPLRTQPPQDHPPLVLTLLSPPSPVTHTREPQFWIEGTAEGRDLAWVHLDGITLTTRPGPFRSLLRLADGENTLRVVAEGKNGQRTQHVVTVILDQTAPRLVLGSPKTVLATESPFILHGRVAEPFLGALQHHTPGTPPEAVHVQEDGTFRSLIPLKPGENQIRLEATDQAGNQSHQEVTVRYETEPQFTSPPSPPTELAAAHARKSLVLAWTPPALFESGARIPPGMQLRYRVTRESAATERTSWGHPRITETTKAHHSETVPAYGEYRYSVQAVVQTPSQTAPWSMPSTAVVQSVVEPQAVMALGEFEPPFPVTPVEHRTLLPKTALSQHGQKKHLHLAYIVRRPGQENQDAIAYRRSEISGAPGSFVHRAWVLEPKRGQTITDVAVAATPSRVLVGFIEQNEKGEHHIQVWEKDKSDDRFFEVWSDRVSREWKRDLSMAFDGFGHHHMVWNEGNKIYYARDFEEEESKTLGQKQDHHRLSVFDVPRRRPAREVVQYKVQYEPVNGECRCAHCWCEESYVLGENEDAEATHIDWLENSYAYAPSLWVDDRAVYIVARQFRAWDDKPVENPAWLRMAKDPVFGASITYQPRPTRHVVGWRETWKKHYESGDRLLWEHIGHQWQYLYEGTWHEDDHIKIAMRPLQSPLGPKDKVRAEQASKTQPWRISTIDTVTKKDHQERPSYPHLVSTPGGELVVVYEKGSSSNANQPNGNAIHMAQSDDGGLTWSSPHRLRAGAEDLRGYMPDIAVASDGALLVAYGAPRAPTDSTPKPSAKLMLAKSPDGGETWTLGELSQDPRSARHYPVKPPHLNPQGSHAEARTTYEDSYFAVPAVQTLGTLAVVTFAGDGATNEQFERIFATRASWDNEVRQVSTTIRPSLGVSNHAVQATVRAVNGDHVAVYKDVPKSSETSVLAPASEATGSPPPQIAPFQGQIEFTLAPGAAAASVVTFDNAHVDLRLAEPETSGVSANYARAWSERKALLRTDLSLAPEEANEKNADEQAPQRTTEYFYKDRFVPEGTTGLYLVEYRPNEVERAKQERWEAAGTDDVSTSPDAQDAQHLAGYKRVWAYTMGIALAQASREGDPDAQRRAQGLARSLCAQAVLDAQHDNELKGWHFSWNTQGDHWRDARLVTGATAWAVHGLGVFLSSLAYDAMNQDQNWLKRCYEMSLRGLLRHRRKLHTEGGQEVYLMSAGWTTRGLRHASKPHTLGLSVSRQGRLGYYSVLDVIGYDHYDPDFEPSVKVCDLDDACAAHRTSNEDVWKWKLLTKTEWQALKQEDHALNVVTEHNLDVLSVLNHALDHASALGLNQTQDLNQEHLERWRDKLRRGIFTLLWDETGWIQEFEATIAQNPNTNEARAMREALDSERPLGRMVTGSQGDLTPKANQAALSSGQGDLEPLYALTGQSHHSAIDNCSWLSLSVDYRDLTPERSEGTDTEYVQKLDRCLQYTVIRYVKELGFCLGDQEGACPNQNGTYTGAHYFQNDFRDLYIAPSVLQTSSYHLEATMGLIMGLLQFKDAHPEHRRATEYETLAHTLWAESQRFVRDHGFPYSSQRIQDLSTRLYSSTAIVWFMDVHDHLQPKKDRSDGPLAHYALGIGVKETARFVNAAHTRIDAFLKEGPSNGEGSSSPTFETQALALWAASKDHDPSAAAKWFKSLALTAPLAARSSAPAPTSEAEPSEAEGLGSAVTLGQKMVALGAIAAFSKLNGVEPDLASQAQSLLRAELLFLESQAFRHDLGHQLPDGGLSPGRGEHEVGHDQGLFHALPDAAHADVDDNVLAYFALKEASPQEPVFLDWAERIGARLAELCGNEGGTRPIKRVFREGASVEADGPSTYALCSLFFLDAQAPGKALALLDALAFARTHAPQSFSQSTGEGGAEPLAWLDLIGVPLARRGVRGIDSRQEALALVELSALRNLEAPDPAAQIAARLVHQPSGFLGVQAGPALVSANPRPPVRRSESWLALEDRLKVKMVETLGALLASDFEAHRFDELFRQLVRIHFGLKQLAFGSTGGGPTPPEAWARKLSASGFSDRVRETVHDLFALCAQEADLLAEASVSLDAFLGTPQACAVVENAVAHLLRARTGTSPDQLVEILPYDHEEDLLRLNDLVRLTDPVVGALPEPSGLKLRTAPNRWQGIHRLFEDHTSSVIPPDASLEGIQKTVRARLVHVVENALTRAREDKQPIHFELSGIDPIEAFSPASLAYWLPTHVALRLALKTPARHHVQFSALGVPVDPPLWPLSAEKQVRSTQLRQFIHTFGEGRLVPFSHRIAMRPGWLHSRLRQGVLSTADFDMLVDGHAGGQAHALGPSTQDAWRNRLSPVDDDRAHRASVLGAGFGAPWAPWFIGSLAVWDAAPDRALSVLSHPQTSTPGDLFGFLGSPEESALAVAFSTDFQFGPLEKGLVEVTIPEKDPPIPENKQNLLCSYDAGLLQGAHHDVYARRSQGDAGVFHAQLFAINDKPTHFHFTPVGKAGVALQGSYVITPPVPGLPFSCVLMQPSSPGMPQEPSVHAPKAWTPHLADVHVTAEFQSQHVFGIGIAPKETVVHTRFVLDDDTPITSVEAFVFKKSTAHGGVHDAIRFLLRDISAGEQTHAVGAFHTGAFFHEDKSILGQPWPEYVRAAGRGEPLWISLRLRQNDGTTFDTTPVEIRGSAPTGDDLGTLGNEAELWSLSGLGEPGLGRPNTAWAMTEDAVYENMEVVPEVLRIKAPVDGAATQCFIALKDGALEVDHQFIHPDDEARVLVWVSRYPTQHLEHGAREGANICVSTEPWRLLGLPVPSTYTLPIRLRNKATGYEVERSIEISLGENRDESSLKEALTEPKPLAPIGEWAFEKNTRDSTGHYAPGVFPMGPMPAWRYEAGVGGRGHAYRPSTSPIAYGAIQVPSPKDALRFGGDESFSISVWLNPARTLTEDGVVVGNRDEAGQGFELRVMTDHRAAFLVTNPLGTPTAHTLISVDALRPGEWNHVAVTWEGPIQEGLLYVNGIANASMNLSFYPSWPGLEEAGPLAIGGHWGAKAVSHVFDGLIDQLQIYGQALSVEAAEKLAGEYQNHIAHLAAWMRPSPELLELFEAFTPNPNAGRDEGVTVLEDVSSANVARVKAIKQSMKGTYAGLQRLILQDASLAAAVLPFALPAGAIMAGQADVGLETMVVFEEAPSSAWVEVGSVQAGEIVREAVFFDDKTGVGLFFEDEETIRSHREFDTQAGTQRPFEDGRIYGFDARHLPEILPLRGIVPESGGGTLDLSIPDLPRILGDDGRVKVFALDTTHSRGEVIDNFLRHHQWWQAMLEIAAHLPSAALQEGFLRWGRAFLLGWFFDAKTAERAVKVDRNDQGKRPSWWLDAAGYSSLSEKKASPFTRQETGEAIPLVDSQQEGGTAVIKPAPFGTAPPPIKTVRLFGTNKAKATIGIIERSFTVPNSKDLMTEDPHAIHGFLVRRALEFEYTRLAKLAGHDPYDASFLGFMAPFNVDVPEAVRLATKLRTDFNNHQGGERISVLNISLDSSFANANKFRAWLNDDFLAAVREARAAGITIFVAAGNDGKPLEDVHPNAKALSDYVIFVTALNSFGPSQRASLRDYANTGPSVKLAAAGRSAVACAEDAERCGTTFASPHAAALGLVLDLEALSHKTQARPIEIEQALVQTSLSLDELLGSGIVQPMLAIGLIRAAAAKSPFTERPLIYLLDRVSPEPPQRTGTTFEAGSITTTYLYGPPPSSLSDVLAEPERFIDVVLFKREARDPFEVLTGEEIDQAIKRNALTVAEDEDGFSFTFESNKDATVEKLIAQVENLPHKTYGIPSTKLNTLASNYRFSGMVRVSPDALTDKRMAKVRDLHQPRVNIRYNVVQVYDRKQKFFIVFSPKNSFWGLIPREDRIITGYTASSDGQLTSKDKQELDELFNHTDQSVIRLVSGESVKPQARTRDGKFHELEVAVSSDPLENAISLEHLYRGDTPGSGPGAAGFSERKVYINRAPLTDVELEVTGVVHGKPIAQIFLKGFVPQSLYAAFPVMNGSGWQHPKVAVFPKESQVVVSMSGTGDPTVDENAVQEIFQRLPDQPYVRVVMPNRSVVYYTPTLDHFVGESYAAADPLAAFDKGLARLRQAESRNLAFKPTSHLDPSNLTLEKQISALTTLIEDLRRLRSATMTTSLKKDIEQPLTAVTTDGHLAVEKYFAFLRTTPNEKIRISVPLQKDLKDKLEAHWAPFTEPLLELLEAEHIRSPRFEKLVPEIDALIQTLENIVWALKVVHR